MAMTLRLHFQDKSANLQIWLRFGGFPRKICHVASYPFIRGAIARA
jgi:hypothetical protein